MAFFKIYSRVAFRFEILKLMVNLTIVCELLKEDCLQDKNAVTYQNHNHPKCIN